MDGLPLRPLRVAVVADDPLVRSLLVEALAGGVQFSGDGEYADAEVWDLGQDSRAGLDRLERRDRAGVPVVALLSDPILAREALNRGARGVLPRLADPQRLLASLRAVAAGLRVLDDVGLPSAPTVFMMPPVNLTAREREVLDLMAQGIGNRDVGKELGISEHTAKFHVHAILDKLGAMTRTEAVVLAARSGLLTI